MKLHPPGVLWPSFPTHSRPSYLHPARNLCKTNNCLQKTHSEKKQYGFHCKPVYLTIHLLCKSYLFKYLSYLSISSLEVETCFVPQAGPKVSTLPHQSLECFTHRDTPTAGFTSKLSNYENNSLLLHTKGPGMEETVRTFTGNGPSHPS